MDKDGFVRTGPKGAKFVHGIQTGDIIKAIVTKGSKAGTYVGRVAVRTSCSFNITTAKGTVQGISFKYCRAIQRLDGYSYRLGEVFPAQPARKEDFLLPMPEGQGFPKVDV
jgi:hypothetical protein